MPTTARNNLYSERCLNNEDLQSKSINVEDAANELINMLCEISEEAEEEEEEEAEEEEKEADEEGGKYILYGLVNVGTFRLRLLSYPSYKHLIKLLGILW